MTGFEVAGGALVLAGTVSAGLWKVLHKRPTPEALELRRRTEINGKGKLVEGEIVDIDAVSASVMYSYVVAGAGYTTSQDVSALQQRLPADVMAAVGPASVKFDPRNPANSIVVCEFWSGLHSRRDSAAFRDSMVS